MISDLGYGTFFFFSTVLVCLGVSSFLFVPETKGLTLEEMDALFMEGSVSRTIILGMSKEQSDSDGLQKMETRSKQDLM